MSEHLERKRASATRSPLAWAGIASVCPVVTKGQPPPNTSALSQNKGPWGSCLHLAWEGPWGISGCQLCDLDKPLNLSGPQGGGSAGGGLCPEPITPDKVLFTKKDVAPTSRIYTNVCSCLWVAYVWSGTCTVQRGHSDQSLPGPRARCLRDEGPGPCWWGPCTPKPQPLFSWAAQLGWPGWRGEFLQSSHVLCAQGSGLLQVGEGAKVTDEFISLRAIFIPAMCCLLAVSGVWEAEDKEIQLRRGQGQGPARPVGWGSGG